MDIDNFVELFKEAVKTNRITLEYDWNYIKDDYFGSKDMLMLKVDGEPVSKVYLPFVTESEEW